MSKKTIEVPDDLIPEGYELVRVGLATSLGDDEYEYAGTYGVCVVPIFRKLLDPWEGFDLSWIKPGWIAKDRDGSWFWFFHKPEINENCWIRVQATANDMSKIGDNNSIRMPNVSWENSLKRIKRA